MSLQRTASTRTSRHDAIHTGGRGRRGFFVLFEVLVLLAVLATAVLAIGSLLPATSKMNSASTEAEIAGDGIVLVDAAGEPLAAIVDQIASDRIVVTPQVPLENGAYGIAWTMKAGDAHPKSGSVAFRVNAPPVAADSTWMRCSLLLRRCHRSLWCPQVTWRHGNATC